MLVDNLLQSGSWEAGARAGREAEQREWRGEPVRGDWADVKLGRGKAEGSQAEGCAGQTRQEGWRQGWESGEGKTVGTEKTGSSDVVNN